MKTKLTGKITIVIGNLYENSDNIDQSLNNDEYLQEIRDVIYPIIKDVNIFIIVIDLNNRDIKEIGNISKLIALLLMCHKRTKGIKQIIVQGLTEDVRYQFELLKLNKIIELR